MASPTFGFSIRVLLQRSGATSILKASQSQVMSPGSLAWDPRMTPSAHKVLGAKRGSQQNWFRGSLSGKTPIERELPADCSDRTAGQVTIDAFVQTHCRMRVHPLPLL